MLVDRADAAAIIQFYFDTVLFNSKNEFRERPIVKGISWDPVTDKIKIDCVFENE